MAVVLVHLLLILWNKDGIIITILNYFHGQFHLLPDVNAGRSKVISKSGSAGGIYA